MKPRKSILLLLSCGGMMLSCFNACTSFIFASTSPKPFPLPEATAILFLTTSITCIHNQKEWRWIYIIVIHLVGISCSSLWVYHRYYMPENPFWRFSWVSEILFIERAFAGWFTLFLILICICMLWFCGIRLWTKPTEQSVISHRFDLGLGLLLLLLLIKLIIVVKGGSIPTGPSSTDSLLSFIILGLFSMGIVRTKSASKEGGVVYIKGAGIVLSFMFITLVLGGGLFILFLPKLQTFAEVGSDMLGTMKEPIGRILIGLFRYKPGSSVNGQSERQELPYINQFGGDIGIFHYLFIGFGIAIMLYVVGFILHRLFKWVLSKFKWFISKTEKENNRQRIWQLLLLLISSVNNLFSVLWIKIFSNINTSSTAEYVFKLLLRWGRLSGLKHSVFETPKEYGFRLRDRFPQIDKEIKLIIHLHDAAIYGFTFPDSYQISCVKLAMKRIRSPRLWFTRMKSLLFWNRI